jgi:hypothetical protein
MYARHLPENIGPEEAVRPVPSGTRPSTGCESEAMWRNARAVGWRQGGR